MIHSTLTDQGQTTIPAQVRKTLGLKPRQRLNYEFVEGGVLIRPETETLMDLAGSLKSDRGPFTKQQIEEGLAEAAVERHRRALPGTSGDDAE